MPRFINPSSVPQPTSRYSQGVVLGTAYKRVIVSGQIGADADGNLAEGLEAQMQCAFGNFLRVVAAADLTVDDVVRIDACVTVPGSHRLFIALRESLLGKVVPASTYREVAGLSLLSHLVEIDGEAVREAPLAAPEGLSRR